MLSYSCLQGVFVISAQALHVLYGALNNPSQLTGWKADGGDPCGESWKGVKCDGSAVVSLYGSAQGVIFELYIALCLFLVHICNLCHIAVVLTGTSPD